MTDTMKQIVLASYAKGNPKPSDFRLEEVPLPTAGDREILLRTLWLAVDPLFRFAIDEVRLSGATHLELGDVMVGATVSEVVASNHPDYEPGDVVEGRTGWREYAVVAPDQSDYRGPPRKLDRSLAPVSTALGVLGMPGQTAHGGVETLRIKPGDTVAISAAAGAVGSIAGQIARIKGARAVGIAGGPAKCQALLDLGFDGAADYKSPDFAAQLKAAAPNGIDCYFDNTGGDVTLEVFRQLNRGARMAMCGYIAYYGMGFEGPGPDHMPALYRTIMNTGLEIRGFAGVFAPPSVLEEIAGWISDGKITYPETVVEGLESAPDAFASVFSGNDAVGKLLVRVADLA
ncbi:NADP-dependent oxidoreductase [Novosphingobium sp. JCM 18896]|uniref:NADP-dependent oxidoreductase n=1 Tax=Novosphingobium sp. JCM 18896 TaxID=2989731 RepID=UPI002223E55F|nr:NADP-dependent oxidoreductase [Novosphingobium sp. JCM 18896]MCW1428746.1 NADP-dependent oxidoreductase [Novosphingobium sp. JCM 18896]